MLRYVIVAPEVQGAALSMKCPYCRKGNFEVTDSRSQNGDFPIRRKRCCSHCQRKVVTVEHLEDVPLKVIKKTDGRREPFDPAKLRAGLEKACYKRPVTDAQIEQMAQTIENDVYDQYFGEVPSSVIGDLAMKQLRQVDQVAYVRFASVYREFQDVSDFVQELRPMLRQRRDGNQAKTAKG
ncbi:MAG: transcriptional regulator NrdR [Gemmataceae bacterium]